MPKVSFGLVNCNRLHYFRSCLESLLESTQDYSNKEIVVIDNASVEEGTEEYLRSLEERGIARVIRQLRRDPSNEFARACNRIVQETDGKYVVPLQGDMQFVLDGGWLQRYVELCEKNDGGRIGCINLDAQRRITHESHHLVLVDGTNDYEFFYDLNRPPVAGACDVFVSRETLQLLGPWDENNAAHEGGGDSETKMLRRIASLNRPWAAVVPRLPPAVAIYTDIRGTNARVRGNRRYGDYWPPKEEWRYYAMWNLNEARYKFSSITSRPISIEEWAKPIGFDSMIDEKGNWKKNPIRPDSALRTDYVELQPSVETKEEVYLTDPDFLKEWLGN